MEPVQELTDTMDLDGTVFVPVANSEGGEVDPQTRFHYHQRDGEIWADYAGGNIRRGFLVGLREGDRLTFRYVHLSAGGETDSGHCESIVTRNEDGLLLLEESWQWDSRIGSGTSILKQTPP